MATTPAPEPIIAAPPVEPTPLNPPVVVYNKKWRVPAMIVTTQEELDALDPTEWTQNPPPVAAKETFPKLFYNVNLAPKIVGNAADEASLGDEWAEFTLPQDLVTAAQAKIDAAK